VIVAEQVQQAVEGQNAKLLRERMPERSRLPRRDPARDHDVAEMRLRKVAVETGAVLHGE
jgi:hypothetical protein